MTTRHLDLGCGPTPRNPYRADEAHGLDIALPPGLSPDRFRRADLTYEPIPHPDSSFDSISAFDFLEHVPRVFPAADGRSSRFPFIALMDEIWRVLKPGGRFYAITPGYPRPEAFQDPTHVNFITLKTHEYFCESPPKGRMYGFQGAFEALRVDWALLPQDFEAARGMPGWPERFRRWRRKREGKESHIVWEFAAIKPKAGDGR